MQICVAQFASTLDKAANLAEITRLVELTAAHRPDLVVLPEASMADFGAADTALGPLAEPLDGPFVTALARLATRHRTAIVAGMFEATADPAGRPYNTLALVDATGRLAATYRKTHLFDAFGYQESARLLPGDGEPVLADVAGVTVGLQTCYDVRFPELSRLLAQRGAQLLALPAAWVRGPVKEHQWTTLVQARAIENTCYIAAADQCGTEYCGLSLIVDPMGRPVAGLAEEPGVAAGPMSLDRLAQVRRRNPTLDHARLAVGTPVAV